MRLLDIVPVEEYVTVHTAVCQEAMKFVVRWDGTLQGVASLFTYPYVRDADWFAAGIPPYGNLYEYQRKQDTMTDLPQSLPQAWRPPMGWNSWDSYGTTLTEDELLANARFMAEHLKNAGWDTLVIDIDWYDPTARAHGYNDNAPLILDEYGRQLPDPVRFPSAAGGKGFGPLAAAVHELGLKLGMHMMRGIPRIAVDKNLPVYGTNYTAKDVADLDHVCKWNPDNYGLNQSHPARRPGMTRSSTCSPPGASTSSRSTTCRPRSTPTKSPPIIAPSPKPKPNTAVRLTCLSRPAAGWRRATSTSCARTPKCGVFPTICGTVGKTSTSSSPAWPAGRRSRPPATGPTPTWCRSGT